MGVEKKTRENKQKERISFAGIADEMEEVVTQQEAVY